MADKTYLNEIKGIETMLDRFHISDESIKEFLSKVPAKDPAKDPAKELVKDLAKEPVKEPVKEAAKEAAKEPVKEVVKEAAKEPVKEAAKEVVKEAAKVPSNKELIIELFMKNVKNKNLSTAASNTKHDGKEGHALEKAMNIKHNASNAPDLHGYEMKKDSNKITFGDFSASEYLFSLKRKTINTENKWKDDENKLTRDEFIKFFGTKNIHKDNRYAWSGACIPKYNVYNYNGTIFKFNANNDLCIYYSHSKDTREEKTTLPEYLKKEDVLIVFWSKDKLKNHIDKKFNDKGFFICLKDKKTNLYNKIGFGEPFSYSFFVANFKTNKIFFDSGMYCGNERNYSSFRASGNFWRDLITEEF